jgi:hypothetical protein
LAVVLRSRQILVHINAYWSKLFSMATGILAERNSAMHREGSGALRSTVSGKDKVSGICAGGGEIDVRHEVI